MRAFFVILLFCLGSVVPVVYGQGVKIDFEKLNNDAFKAYENGSDSAFVIADRFSDAAKGSNSVYEINAHTLLGILNKDRGYYASALNNYLKALNVSQELNDLGRESACLNNIVSIYQLQQNYERAKDYYLRSLSIEDSLDQPLQKSIRFYNLGDVYKEQDSLEIALTYFNSSLRIEQKLNNDEGVVYALLGIAEVYIKFNRPTDARIELEKVNSLIKLNDIEEKILYHFLRGKLALLEGTYSAGLNELETALRFSRDKDFRIHDEKLLLGKIEMLKKMNDHKGLAETYEEYIALVNNLNSIAIKNQLEDLTYQNELNKKELEISMIKEERDLARRNEEIKEDINAYSKRIIWFLVLAILGIFTFVFFTVKKISNKW